MHACSLLKQCCSDKWWIRQRRARKRSIEKIPWFSTECTFDLSVHMCSVVYFALPESESFFTWQIRFSELILSLLIINLYQINLPFEYLFLTIKTNYQVLLLYSATSVPGPFRCFSFLHQCVVHKLIFVVIHVASSGCWMWYVLVAQQIQHSRWTWPITS